MNDIFIKLAEAFLQKIAKDSDQYTSEKAVIKVSQDAVTLFTPDYLQFAVSGRGPGKKPPLDNILAFVKSKGIIFDGTDQRGTAFAIQASIAKKGTANWKPNAPNALQEMIDDNLGEYYKSLNVEVMARETEETNKIWEKQFPSKVEFRV
mgnify:CR=1 FL=1